MSNIKLFESKQIRSVWNEQEEKWYFVVEDVISVLTDSADPKQYVKRMRQRDPALKKGWVQIVPTLAVNTAGGIQKMGCSDANGLLRIIQSIPSPKAEPFKRWLAKVGAERLKEITVNADTQGFDENKRAAKAGGKIASDARKQLELKSGKKVVTNQNYLPENKNKKIEE